MNTLERMLHGFPDVNEVVAAVELDDAQRQFIAQTVDTAARYGETELGGERSKKWDERFERATGFRLSVPESSPRAAPGTHYLTDDEVADWERTGLLGPFDAISPGEAESLRRLAYERHESGDFTRNSLGCSPVHHSLARSGSLTINHSGVYQALRLKPFWELVRSPELAHRLASLLGPDVLCWRTQFFEKQPGDEGTFWHQNSVFREGSKLGKLTPTLERDPGMVQLTCWVALTDVTAENGALRIIPGTFPDGRLEVFYDQVLDDPIDFLARVPADQAEKLVKTVHHTTGHFYKAQAIFRAVSDRCRDILEGKAVKSLEMKAGQAVIFTSMNMHASHPNSTSDQTRLAFAGRYTTNDVKVLADMPTDVFPTPEGLIEFSTDQLACIQAHGEDRFGFNNIAPAPLP